MRDRRARNLWNADGSLGPAASRALRITARMEKAWNVCLVFGPDARWSGEMPAPTAWMHRVWPGDPRWMEPDHLIRVIRALLPERPAEGR